jgi:hypothetical protein
MKLIDHLEPKQREVLEKKYKLPKSKHKRRKEKLSHNEILELMGVHRDTYKRGRGGALRRK